MFYDSTGREPANKGKRLPPDPPTDDEIKRMIAACNSPGPNRQRNKCMIVMMWRCGLRSKEVRSLHVADLRFDHAGTGSVRVMAPKGVGRGVMPREIGFDRKVTEMLHKWLGKRPDGGTGYLFPVSGGKMMSGSQLRNMVAAVGKGAGVQRRCHPHGLRHAYARDLYEEGLGIVHLQKALGHKDLKTTAEYLGTIGAHDVIAVTKERVW